MSPLVPPEIEEMPTASRSATMNGWGTKYTRAERQVVRFLTDYWIPACVSAELLEVSCSAAYEWTDHCARPPRQAWCCSPLHAEGRQRRERIDRAAELYQQPDLTMRAVGRALNVGASTVHRYLHIANSGWYDKVAVKHAAFAVTYAVYASRIG